MSGLVGRSEGAISANCFENMTFFLHEDRGLLQEYITLSQVYFTPDLMTAAKLAIPGGIIQN